MLSPSEYNKNNTRQVIFRNSANQRCVSLVKMNSSRSFRENERNDFDISNGLERLQVSIINKARAISPLVHSTTLGPLSVYDGNGDATGYNNDKPLGDSSDTLPTNTKNRFKETSPSKYSLEKYTCHSTPGGRNEKLLFELDRERHRCLNISINDRIRETIKSHQSLRGSSLGDGILSDLRIHLDNKRLLEAEQKAVDAALLRQGELLAQKQRQQYEREKAMQFAEKVRKEQEDTKMIMEFQIHEKEFRDRYQTLSESVRSCGDKQALHASSSSSFSTVKGLDDGMKQLSTQCRAGEINHLVLQKASAIIRQLETYSKIIQEEVKKVDKNVAERELLEKERIARHNEEKLALELQAKEAAAASAAAAAAAASAATAAASAAAARAEAAAKQTAAQQQPVVSTEPPKVVELSRISPDQATATPAAPKKINLGYLEGCVDANSFQTYKALKTHLADFQSSFSVLSEDPQYKDFTFSCKKAVNVPVNAIGDHSGEHLLDKFQRLSSLLKGGTVQINNVPFRASGHPQGINFCMDLLANKLVEQGKTTVSSKAEAAFPIAAIIVALWVEIPAFGQIILAHFYKACPYLVPIFLPQVEGQSDEEYWRSRGYQYENGKPEREDAFVKKMGGIMRLYSAVIISSVRRQQRAAHPLSIFEGWRWITCMVNLGPQPVISATLLLVFLEVTGNAMFAAYRQQFQKVLHLICKDYFLKIKEIEIPGTGGHVSRLEGFLHTMLKNGNIPPPRGSLPTNFW